MDAPAPCERIFLSYSHTDEAAAQRLQAALRAAGLSLFRDADSIRPGERWQARLQQALAGCAAFVVLIGRDGVRRWVGAEVEVALERHFSAQTDTARLPIFPVLLDGATHAQLPPLLALHQAVHWAADQPVPQSLLEAIQQGEVRAAAGPFDGCPYVGLDTFQRKDARIFFGRSAETLAALRCFGDPSGSDPEQLSPHSGAGLRRWVQIEGASGAGKSSLVRAGLLPLIEQGALWVRTGFEHWQVLGTMRPGKEPLAALAEVIERGLIATDERRDSLGRLQRFEADARALAFGLKDFKRPGTAFLLVVDQFEELLSLEVSPGSAEERSRQRFDAALAHALLDPECPLFLLSTVRADFLHRFDRLPHLAALVNHCCGRYLLPSMSEAGLCEVIEAPARLARLDVREIKDSILAEARDEPGALPLVENALAVLWEHSAGSGRLSGQYLREQGGLAGLLARKADTLLARLDREMNHGKRAALELLLRLTRISVEGGQHTRRRITRTEAIAIDGDAARGEQVLRYLSGGADPTIDGRGSLRLIVIGREHDQTTGREVELVDLIHETLVRARRDAQGKLTGYWPTLYDYLEQHRDRDLAHQQLVLQRQRDRERLEQQSRRWRDSRGFGRVWHLATAGEWWRFRRLGVSAHSERYLAWTRRKLGAQALLLLSVLAVLTESFVWTRVHGLPASYTFIQPLWYLGYRPLPPMVAIPAGAFTMGCVPERDTAGDEKCNADEVFPPSLNPVQVPVFRMGKYEVTFLEYDFYVWQERRRGRDVRYPLDAGWGRHRRPVINVSWDEAQAYVQWLGTATGNHFALPSEVEWEYAARAQTNTAYWWGASLETADGAVHANCRDCGSRWDGRQSAPVGSFPASPFGLLDTAGNVYEWVQDEYELQYTAQSAGNLRCNRIASQSSGTASNVRVLRGGSWGDVSGYARAALRSGYLPSGRGDGVGFRVCGGAPIENH